MRKFIVLPLLVLLATCTEQTAVGPDGDAGFVAAKGGKKGPPTPEEPNADPAIAFVTYDGRKKGDGYCLRVMNNDGSNDTRLICGSLVSYPSWSPDGRSLAFERTGTIGGEHELWRMDITGDVDGGVPVWSEQGPLATCAGQPAWSPVNNGVQVIAYIEASYSDNCHRNLLRYVTTGGGTPVTLYTAAEGVSVSFPAWSPDASSIAFVELDKGSGQNVWSIKILHLPVKDEPVVDIVFPGEDQFTEIWALDWSRSWKGDHLAFTAWTAASGKGHVSHVYTLAVSQPQGGTWEGGTLTQVIEGRFGVAWSPNDEFLVVKSGRDLVKVNLLTDDYSTETLRPGGFEPDWRRRNPPPASAPQ